MAKFPERHAHRTNYPRQGGMYSSGSTPGLPIPVEVARQGPMSREEATTACRSIRSHLESAGAQLLELHDREGWKALGYASWRECAVAEFGKSQSRVYELLAAARVVREFSEISEKPPTTDSHLRALAKAPEGRRAEAWDAAAKVAGTDKVTARHVAEAVKAMPREPGSDDDIGDEPEPEPESCTCPTCHGTGKVQPPR